MTYLNLTPLIPLSDRLDVTICLDKLVEEGEIFLRGA